MCVCVSVQLFLQLCFYQHQKLCSHVLCVSCACEYRCMCVYWFPCAGVTHDQKGLINTSPWAYSRGTDRNWILLHSHMSDVPKNNNNCCQSVWTHLTFRPLLPFIGGCFWTQGRRKGDGSNSTPKYSWIKLVFILLCKAVWEFKAAFIFSNLSFKLIISFWFTYP